MVNSSLGNVLYGQTDAATVYFSTIEADST